MIRHMNTYFWTSDNWSFRYVGNGSLSWIPHVAVKCKEGGGVFGCLECCWECVKGYAIL